jgi:hypothetical protein
VRLQGPRSRRTVPEVARLEERALLTLSNVGVGPGVHLLSRQVVGSGNENVYQFQVLRTDNLDVKLNNFTSGSSFSLVVTNQASDGGSALGTTSSTSTSVQVALTNLAPGTYYAHITGSTNTYNFSIDPDATSSTTVYYVNDGSQSGDVYTTAVGNDANSGTDPAHPKATVESVLNTYTLGPTSLVVIDTGSYSDTATITSAKQGAAYAGSPAGTQYTSNGTVFELIDADSNEFYGLTFTGAGGTGFYAHTGAAANSRRNTFLDNTFTGTDTAIRIDGGDSDVIQGNVISGGGSYGIYLPSVVSGSISGNTISGRYAAISGYGGPGSNVLIDSNTLSGTGYGISLTSSAGTISNNAVTTGNTQSGNGIYINDAVNVVGNTVSNNDVGILSGWPNGSSATISGNTVFGNVTGIQGYGTIGGTSWATGQPNDLHNNGTGIQSSGGDTIRFNRVHGNAVGIQAASSDTINHDLVYRNTGEGILVDGVSNVAITSDTIYTPSGDGVRIRNGATNVSLRNDILWTDSGYDLYVATDSQVGFSSDYNNFFTANPGAATLVWWQTPFADLFDWQVESNYDSHSIGYTAPNPTLDNPQFVSLAGDDYHLTNLTSSSIDSGDPSSDFSLEPTPNGGRIDLGAYGDTPQAAQSPTSFIRIDYPNYYTDWETSVGHAILWHAYNITGNVHIALYDATGTNKLADIADVPASNGSYGWSPQASGIAGDSSKRYVIRITSDAVGSVTSTTREPFSVPTASPTYFINDASTTGDEYATAQGSNRNTGETAGDPKANLLALLHSYDPGPGNTVYIDMGTYAEIRNVVLSGNPTIGLGAGARFTGPVNHTATLDRGNPYSYATNIELDDAGSVTLTHLSLVDANRGLWVHNQSIRFAGTYLTLANNSGDGIVVESDSSQSAFGYLTAHDNGGNGITISTPIASLSHSTAYNNQQIGIEVTNNSSGLPSIVGDTHLPTDPNTKGGGDVAFDNGSYGFYLSGNVVAAGDVAYGQAGSAGFFAQYGAVVQQSVAHDNGTGIAIGYGSGQAIGNRVFANAGDGIYAGYAGSATVQGNVVYSNSVGIHVSQAYQPDAVVSNLVYANANQGILVESVSQASITNNTVYQPVGDAVRVQGNSSNVALENNILNVLAGYDLFVASDSQTGFTSDYNLLFLGSDPDPKAHLGYWNNSTVDLNSGAPLLNWQSATGEDSH